MFGNADDEVIPWLDQPPPPPFPPSAVGNQLVWENLDSWFTPASNFFYVTHYGIQDNLDPSTWRMEIAGLVARPQSLTLADLKARSRREVDFTIECSGNNGFPFVTGLVGNARWGGAPPRIWGCCLPMRWQQRVQIRGGAAFTTRLRRSVHSALPRREGSAK